MGAGGVMAAAPVGTAVGAAMGYMYAGRAGAQLAQLPQSAGTLLRLNRVPLAHSEQALRVALELQRCHRFS